jgi:tRNA dimethylallyltransferase
MSKIDSMDKTTQQKIDTWLATASEKPKIVLIYGPTACGKTALSLDVAEYLGSEIISVDARQIYRGLDIGTGKIRTDEMRSIPHHMIDIIDPTEVFSVVDYRNHVRELDIWKRLDAQGFSTSYFLPPPSSIPVLAGGTGLYIDSLIYERSYPKTEPDWTLRDELETYRDKNGNEALWNMLHDTDPEYADTLHPNNYRYVMRGIEVYRETGRSKLAAQDGLTLLYDVLFLTPYDGDRSALYSRIDARVEEMFAS